jgi:hypothetical protein
LDVFGFVMAFQDTGVCLGDTQATDGVQLINITTIDGFILLGFKSLAASLSFIRYLAQLLPQNHTMDSEGC